jgi:hypothetical protein
MTRLSEILNRLGIDTSTLNWLYEADGAPVYYLLTPGEKAEALWHKLRDAAGETGRWPLVIGRSADSEDPLAMLEYLIDENVDLSPRKIIEEGLNLDTAEWFELRLDSNLPGEEEVLPDEEPGEETAGPNPSHSFSLPFDLLTSVPHPTVAIALLPTTTPWEVPAYLPFGGWNECPDPHEHLAVMKGWYELHGAEPFGYGGDVVEMFVTRPPQDLPGARALAREQYAYCADIVDQGTETVEDLARGLVASSAWFFWWD